MIHDINSGDPLLFITLKLHKNYGHLSCRLHSQYKYCDAACIKLVDVAKIFTISTKIRL